MWNTPSPERLARIPRLYDTENVPLKDKVIHLHFFLAGCDWYITEYDGGDLFFGYAILNGDHDCAEWGYVSFKELRELKIGFLEVDCELEAYWGFKKASDIKQIKVWDKP
jgi:hypothetical protein